GDVLGSVWVQSATVGWAGGGHGALLRLGPSGWSLEAQPTDGWIGGLWGGGPDGGWAVANEGSAVDEEASVLHGDGSAWQPMTPVAHTAFYELRGRRASTACRRARRTPSSSAGIRRRRPSRRGPSPSPTTCASAPSGWGRAPPAA